jgi:Peptidase family M1 domain
MELEKKTRKISLAGLVILEILVVLLGCNLPERILTPSPNLTSTHVNTPASSPFGLSPSPGNSLDPTQQQVDQTSTPPATPIVPTATSVPSHNVPAQYNLAAVMNFALHSITVVESIHYVYPGSAKLPDLLLVVEPNLVPGGFYLNSITWANGENIDGFNLTENQLTIPLPNPIQPGDELGIVISYTLDLPEIADQSVIGRPEAYGYSDLQANLVDWYPYIPPYDNERGWLVHPTWNLGEYQVYEAADFDVDFSLAQSASDLVIAASAPVRQEGDHYLYHQENARTFVLSISTEYVVQTSTVDGVTITSYSFPYDEAAAQEVLKNTGDALRLFSHLILPYPHPSLSIVEADFLDGMEYDGLFFLSYGFYNLYDGTPKGYLTFIAAHETAHQWWYGLVGNDQAMEPWLDEALCTYMELVFYQNNYLDYSLPSGSSLANWWWYYRVYFYDPTGSVDSSIYDFNDSRAYRNAVYLRGAIFLDELRNLVGDQAFFSFLKDYAQANAYSIATSKDFFTTLREHTSQDLYALVTAFFQTIR